MHGPNPSAIDLGFGLPGRVEHLLRTLPYLGPIYDCWTIATCTAQTDRALRERWEEDGTRERGLNLKSGRLVRAGA